MRETLIRLLELAYFMAPAWCANMAPPFAKYWRGWNRPLHQRSLGAHKTVVGFGAGVVAAMLATAVQHVIDASFSLVDYAGYVPIGLAFGLGAMGGDAAKSFFKRRLDIAPGARWIPLDQIDFAIGALVTTRPWINLGIADVAAILSMTLAGDLAVNRLAFHLGIKDTPW